MSATLLSMFALGCATPTDEPPGPVAGMTCEQLAAREAEVDSYSRRALASCNLVGIFNLGARESCAERMLRTEEMKAAVQDARVVAGCL